MHAVAQNFFPGATQVLIDQQLCTNVTLPTEDFDTLTCIAPPGPGNNSTQLQVVVANSTSAGFRFQYDPPVVARVAPSLCPSNASCLLTISGSNLGLRNAVVLPSLVVYVGGALCAQPNVLRSSEVACVAPAMRVGRYPVVVSLNGQNSSTAPHLSGGPVTVDRLCDARQYGLPGQFCGPCPKVSVPRHCTVADAWH